MKKESSSEECGYFKEIETAIEKLPVNEEQNIELPLEKNKTCSFCGGIPIDKEFYFTFNLKTCNKCKFKNISLITKSTCIKEYLLTQEEIASFKYITRPNPHKGNWSDMQLYLKNEIEDFSIKKYKSLEEIEKIKLTRKNNLLERKKRKIKTKIKELKKKTFLGKEIEYKEKHVHNFVNKNGVSVCDCGLIVEEEEF